MSDVCVVTGGGSGMGLSAALQMPKDKIIISESRRCLFSSDFGCAIFTMDKEMRKS